MSGFIRPWDVNQQVEAENTQPKRSMFDNFGDAISAISANWDEVRGSERLGDLRSELMDSQNLSDDEFNQKRAEYVQEYLNREDARRRYLESQGRLEKDDSFLKNITQMGGTLEGMAAQAIGTGVGAAAGFVTPMAGATAGGAKIGNAVGAGVGAYLDANSVALQAEEEVLEAGGTWEQAQEAKKQALLKASLTTIPETAVDIILGNRLLGSVLGSGAARKLAGSTVGKVGSAVLDPAAKVGTAVSRMSRPIVGRAAGLATDIALQGSTEALQEVTQDYIANREVAKALGQQDNEYTLGGFKDFALSPQGLETMKTASIMGALFGGVGGTLSSGQYLAPGAKTRQGNNVYKATQSMIDEGKLQINEQNRDAEAKVIAHIYGLDESTVLNWSDAQIAAASAEMRGLNTNRVTGGNVRQDEGIIRGGVESINNLFNQEEMANREGELNDTKRDFLSRLGVDESTMNGWFRQPKPSVNETIEQKTTDNGEKKPTVLKGSPALIESVKESEDGKVLQLGVGQENELTHINDNFQPFTLTYNEDNRKVRVSRQDNGTIRVDDYGIDSNEKDLTTANPVASKSYATIEEAKQALLGQGNFRFMKKSEEKGKKVQQKEVKESNDVVNSIDSLIKFSEKNPSRISRNTLLGFSDMLERFNMVEDSGIDFQFALNEDRDVYGTRDTNRNLTRAIVRLYKGSNLITAVHEVAHNAYWNLTKGQRDFYNAYAAKNIGKFLAQNLGEQYNTEFFDKLMNLKENPELEQKINENACAKQVRYLLDSYIIQKSNRQLTQDEMAQHMFKRQEAIEEMFAWEMSMWYAEGFTAGVKPQNMIQRIMQRACFSVSPDLETLSKLYGYIRHHGGDYDKSIEEIYRGAQGNVQYTDNGQMKVYSTMADQSDLAMGQELLVPPIQQVEQEEVAEKETTTEEGKEKGKKKKKNKEEKKKGKKKTNEEELTEQDKQDAEDQEKEVQKFYNYSDRTIGKKLGAVRNKKDGWVKTLQNIRETVNPADIQKFVEDGQFSVAQTKREQSNSSINWGTFGQKKEQPKQTQQPKESKPKTTGRNKNTNNKNTQQNIGEYTIQKDKDPNLGKDAMQIVNKIQKNGKLSEQDRKDLNSIIKRIDALGKQNPYFVLRKDIEKILNGETIEENKQTQKQAVQQTEQNQVEQTNTEAINKALRFVNRTTGKETFTKDDLDGIEYHVNEVSKLVSGSNDEKQQKFLDSLKKFRDRVKNNQQKEVVQETTEEKSVVNNPPQETQQPKVVQEPAPEPVAQPAVQENEDQKLTRLEEELRKLPTTRQIKSKLNTFLSNKNITQQQYDTLLNKLAPQKAETAAVQQGGKNCIAYVEKDGEFSEIRETHRTQKEFKKSLEDRGYKVHVYTSDEKLYQERLNAYKKDLEKAEKKKAEAKAKAEEAKAKAKAKEAKELEDARIAAEKAQREKEERDEAARIAAEKKKADDEAKAAQEKAAKDAEDAKKKKLEETIEKFKNQPLPDNIVDQVFGKTDEFFKYDPKIGEFVGYYKQVDDPEHLNPITNKPLKKIELFGIVDAKTYYKILDKWETLSSSDKEKMTTPIRGIPEFKLKSFATGHDYVRPKIQTQVKSEVKTEQNTNSNTEVEQEQKINKINPIDVSKNKEAFKEREKIAAERFEKIYDNIDDGVDKYGLSGDYVKVMNDKVINIESLVTEGKFTEEKINEVKKDIDNYWDAVSKEDDEEEWNNSMHVHGILTTALDQIIEINNELNKMWEEQQTKNKKTNNTNKTKTTKTNSKPKTEQQGTENNYLEKRGELIRGLDKKYKNITGSVVGYKRYSFTKQEKKFIQQYIDIIKDILFGKAGNYTTELVAQTLDNWYQGHSNESRNKIVHEFLSSYLEDAKKIEEQLKQFKNKSGNTDVRNQIKIDNRANQAAEILNRAFPDTRFQYAWHSTPYNFSEFTLKNLLKGEGAMAHGWGLYFSKDPQANKFRYFDRLNNNVKQGVVINGVDVTDKIKYIENEVSLLFRVSNLYTPKQKNVAKFLNKVIQACDDNISKNKQKIEQTRKELMSFDEYKRKSEFIPEITYEEIYNGRIDRLIGRNNELQYKKKIAQDLLRDVEKYGVEGEKNTNRFLLVEIPDDNVLIREGAKFKEQSKDVQKGIVKLLEKLGFFNEQVNSIVNSDEDFDYNSICKLVEESLDFIYGNLHRNRLMYAPIDAKIDVVNVNTGEIIYKDMKIMDTDEFVSRELNKCGVKGIQYNGRMDGECAVIFDNKSVDILSKFNKEQGKFVKENGEFNKENRENDEQKAQKKLQKRHNNSRNMAIGELGRNSPLANKNLVNSLESAWEKSYRKWGKRFKYSEEEIENSLKKYRNVENEKVFDNENDKLAGIYARLNDEANSDIWHFGTDNKQSEQTIGKFRRELDGKWRYYISDNKMQFKQRVKNLLKMKNTGKTLTLDQVIKHDQLFKYYPELKNLKVEICDSTYDKELKDTTVAYYDNHNNIILNSKYLNDVKEIQKTILHEVQHVIQEKEGFGIGGSLEDFGLYQKQLNSFAKNIFKKKEDFRQFLLNKGFDEKTVVAKLDTYFFKDEKSLENIVKGVLNKNPSGKYQKEFKSWISSDNKLYNEYNNLLGEAEAREQEKRFDLSDEMLEVQPPMMFNDSVKQLKYNEDGRINVRGVKQNTNTRKQLKSEQGRTKADTNTPAFKKWFGNSTAVNVDGSPKVFYRGQGHEYNPNYKFDKTDANHNKFTWVAETKEFVERGMYNGENGEGDLWEVYIRAENPFNIGQIDYLEGYEKTPQQLYEHIMKKLKNEVKYRRITQEQLDETRQKLSYLRNGLRSDGKKQTYCLALYHYLDRDTKLVGALKDLGYDSILGIEDDTNTFALFDPNQVKSIYNNGNWSHPTDIREQKKSKRQKKKEKREEMQKKAKEAMQEGFSSDKLRDVYSVEFDESAQSAKSNQKVLKYLDSQSEYWEKDEKDGSVIYTRKTPFEHQKRVLNFSGTNGITVGEKKKTKLGEWYEYAKDQAIKYFFNDKHFLAKLARKLGAYDSYVNMIVTEGYALRANVALTEGIMYNGKRTRALNDLIKEIGYDDQNDFMDYCIAKRIQEIYNKKNQYKEWKNIEQTFSAEECNEIIKNVENSDKAEKFERCRKDFVEYNHALLGVLYDGGLITKEKYEYWLKRDEQYIPLTKLMDDDAIDYGGFIQESALINVKSPIHKLGSSNRKIKNPFLEMQKRTARYYADAARNKAGMIFVKDICGSLDEMFDGKKGLRGQGIIREVKVDPEKGRLITKTDNKQQIFRVHVDGKEKFYQVADREIYLALKCMSDSQMSTLQKMIDRVAHFPSGLIRETATIVPDFGIRNLIRDNTEAFLTSEHGFFPFFDALWGMYQMANNTEWYQRYIEQVGEYGTLNREEERMRGVATYQNTIDDKMNPVTNWKNVTEKAYKDFCNPKNSPQKRIFAGIKLFISPIWAGGKTLKRFNDYMEQGTRIGEFKNAKMGYEGFLDRMTSDALSWDIDINKADKSDVYAAGAAKEITLNFQQYGIIGKQANRYIPFFNAAMQGLYKFGNTMDLLLKGNDMSNQKNRRLQKELAFKTAMLVAFGIGTAAAGYDDEDYAEAPEWEKRNFWILPNGVRIPKDQVLGTLVGTAAETSYTQWRSGKTKPSELLEAIAEHFAPNNIVPALLDITVAGMISNYDTFKKQQIVPEYMKNLRGFQQKDINTSNLAQDISTNLYKTLGWDVSAKKIDWAINKNLSNTAKYMNSVYDLAFADNEKMARGYDKSDSTGKFVGGLRDSVPAPLNLVTGTFATNRTSFKSVNDFQKRYNELKVIASDEATMSKEEKREWKRYQAAEKKNKQLRKQLKAIKENASLSGAQKREKADKIFQQQIKLAKWAEG